MARRPQAQREPMSNEVLAARRIYERLQSDPSFTVTRARAAYREAFGVSPDDPSIDMKYAERIVGHLGYARLYSWCAADVAIPLPIALAYFLREISGRKSKTSPALRHGEIAQMEEAKQLKAKLMDELDKKAGDAEEDAAEISFDTFEWRGQRRSLLTKKQILERFRHPTRYGVLSIRRQSR